MQSGGEIHREFIRGLNTSQEIIVEHSTDIKRLKQQSLDATVLTMEGDPQGRVLISRAGVVEKVGYMNDEMMTMIPQGATHKEANLLRSSS